jgi:TM2 domain-containing membrane protein YozV
MSSPETTPPAEFPALPPPTVAAPVGNAALGPIKAPWVALLLSLMIPGLGQIYNGQFAKALTFFIAFSGSIYLITEGHPLPFAVFLPFIIFSNMIDAFRSATLINARGTKAALDEDDIESPGWGIGLAVMGVLLLLNNLGWLHLGALVRYWPLALIAAGVVLLRRSLQGKAGNGSHGPSV